MIVDITKQGWLFQPIRVLEITQEKNGASNPKTVSDCLRLSVVKLDSNTSHLHLGCKVFISVCFFWNKH